MTGRAGDAQAPPCKALLGDVHRDVAGAVGAGGRPAAGLRQHVLGPDVVPVLVEHVLGAPVPTGLLVGDAEVDQRPLRAEALGGQAAERDGHRRRDVEHVDGSAPPHLTVDDLTTERVLRPTVGVDGHHVGVAHQAQRRRRRITALDPGDDRGPARVTLVAGDFEAGTFEVGLQEVGVAGLPAGVGGAIVDAGVADELLQQLRARTRQLVDQRHASDAIDAPGTRSVRTNRSL